MMRLMISQTAISKSIWGNLNMRLKKRGILISLRRDEGVEPKLEGPPVGRGREMCGFMADGWVEATAGRARVESAWWLSSVTANRTFP